MARQDLLSLSPDDLATLANRGLVKRAQQEFDSGQFTLDTTEDATGAVTARWSDGVECTFPAGATFENGRCTCPSVTICRHLIRSVFGYQRFVKATNETAPDSGGSESQAAGASTPASWNPGDIPEDALAAHFKKTELTRIRKQFDEGVVVEVMRGAKPSAIFHSFPCALRFLVPNDIRYAACDCAETAPCVHVPLAVWAFRALPPEHDSGLVSSSRASLPVPADVLDDIESVVLETIRYGISRLPDGFSGKLLRLEIRCRDAGLVWPAEILAEIVHQIECYRTRDARFSPYRVTELVGELCIRRDAIDADTGAVPQLFMRGSASDRVTEVGSARMIGLGCEAGPRHGGVTLSTFLQDGDSGTVVVVRRDFPDPPPDSGEHPKDFARLAHMVAFKRTPFQTLSVGQILVKGGKRTPGNEFMPGRASAAVNPQSFQWELLRAPTLADRFGELRTRLGALPPAVLRPRRLADNVFVCPVKRVEAADFVTADQTVRAVMSDAEGNQAMLVHPYTSRGRSGAEALLAALKSYPDRVRFVSGRFKLDTHGLTFAPIALVFQDGAARFAVQPWIDECLPNRPAEEIRTMKTSARLDNPIDAFVERVFDTLGELLLIGLDHADAHIERLWNDLLEIGRETGFVRFLKPVEAVERGLREKLGSVRWDGGPTAQAVLHTTVLSVLAREISV